MNFRVASLEFKWNEIFRFSGCGLRKKQKPSKQNVRPTKYKKCSYNDNWQTIDQYLPNNNTILIEWVFLRDTIYHHHRWCCRCLPWNQWGMKWPTIYWCEWREPTPFAYRASLNRMQWINHYTKMGSTGPLDTASYFIEGILWHVPDWMIQSVFSSVSDEPDILAGPTTHNTHAHTKRHSIIVNSTLLLCSHTLYVIHSLNRHAMNGEWRWRSCSFRVSAPIQDCN